MRRLILLSLSLFLLLALAAVVPAAAQSSGNVGLYKISNVFDVETRSAIAATGANVYEVGRDYVLAEATADEARALGRLGFTLELQPSIQVFPPADSNYHDYAEMVADDPEQLDRHELHRHRPDQRDDVLLRGERDEWSGRGA